MKNGFRIGNELGVTVFAILSGLAVLALAAWAFAPGGCLDRSDPEISPVPLGEETAAPAPLTQNPEKTTGDTAAE